MKITFNNRKILYFILTIVMILVFTLTIAYAALNTVLKITGNTQVNAADWDIHFANPIVKDGSVNSNIPIITGSNNVNFSAVLSNPGDYYEFTIDVVNDGAIDAIIDSVIKTPELTVEQSKYIKYEIKYENGENISTKQLIETNSFVRLKVELLFRRDITALDLPTSSISLDLNFKLVYVQSDGNDGNSVPDNGVRQLTKVISGDLETVGSEVLVADERFYVIGNDSEFVTLLSKYNLLVGNRYDGGDKSLVTALSDPTGRQDSSAMGNRSDSDGNNVYPWIGTVKFASSNYWSESFSNFPANLDVLDNDILVYLNNYKHYIENEGVLINEIRLILYDELVELGCPAGGGYCGSNVPSWIYQTTYWTGSVHTGNLVWGVNTKGHFALTNYYEAHEMGVRPVIKISVNNFLE